MVVTAPLVAGAIVVVGAVLAVAMGFLAGVAAVELSLGFIAAVTALFFVFIVIEDFL